MFEEVRETRATCLFISRAYVVIDSDGHNGDGPILTEDNTQTVGERKFFNWS